MNIYPFIEAEKKCRRNVKRACELLKVSRAAFYAHLSGQSRREQDDAEVTAEIQAVHEESKCRYGARGSTPCCAAAAGIMAASGSPA